jgi:hypothetical protein
VILRSTWVFLFLAGLSWGAPAGAQQGAAPGAHGTRTSAVFAELEDSLLQAVRGGRPAELEGLLDDDFLMTVAQEPAEPVSRPDWLDSVRKTGSGDWAIAYLNAREFGPVAVVSFRLQPAAGRTGVASLFVVDTWQRGGKGWRLMSRHVAPAAGPRRNIPGDAPGQAIRKK